MATLGSIYFPQNNIFIHSLVFLEYAYGEMLKQSDHNVEVIRDALHTLWFLELVDLKVCVNSNQTARSYRLDTNY